MERPAPEKSRRRRLWRASAAVYCALALLSCALLACLAALAALQLARPRQWPLPPPQSGARLVLNGPNKSMKEGKLEWYADNRMDGVFLGPGFEYNPASHTLKIKNRGLYYIYAQLSAFHLIKRFSEEEGNATLTIHHVTAQVSAPILTLPLRLSSHPNKSIAAFTAVSPYQLAGGDLLYVTLTVSHPAKENQRNSTQWYFGDNTVFGLSLISGNCNSEATGINGCSPASLEVEWILKDFCKFFQSNV
ncbi:tumor necrosis factor ligand superfamily member 9 [Eublepharis macularius]|uniref:Tumor necrosis factor ligand superfamily member 9 n=1 Tax=Eublepharis macularius TaxID=481883 RepID=A0AA97LL49_EUBMA|nr:tumor necrosis factor ligand superfamily member 9 [Eublepharis macularius]